LRLLNTCLINKRLASPTELLGILQQLVVEHSPAELNEPILKILDLNLLPVSAELSSEPIPLDLQRFLVQFGLFQQF